VHLVRVLLISHPFPWITGGFKRSYEILRRISEPGLEITLLLSPQMAHELVADIVREGQDPEIIYSCLREVQAAGVTVHPACFRLIDDLFSRFRRDSSQNRFSWRFVIGPLIPASVGIARLLARYEKQYLQDLGTYDIIYSHHECLDTAMLAKRLAKRLGIPFVILFQCEPFRRVGRILKIRPVSSLYDIPALIPELNLNLSQRFEYYRILKSPQFKKFLVISPAPLVISGLLSVPHTILQPANALNDNLLSPPAAQSPDKGDYILFASRFCEEKGIFELPFLWKKIHDQKPALKLLVYGNYTPEILKKFLNRLSDLSLEGSVKIHGYEHDQTSFYNTIRNARLLIHPSHSDGFSLIILESLALGTPVVAYNLPAFTYFYRGFPAMEIVPEWDRVAFCRAAIRILDRPEEYAESLLAPKIHEFIHRHRSWDAVAASERQALLSLMGKTGNGPA
jgi:glycosyltransferase involved in cell wall biosynthesis